jgi:head-tail adaptor
LRTYNTQFDQASNLLKAIRELSEEDPKFEMYVMLGIWIDCENAWTDLTPNHDRENVEANTAEVQRSTSMGILKTLAVID